MILADDLGFGDTDVFPFVGNGVKTPNLREMAARGAVLSNFYTAATVCTPTRASVLTGMYPWRMGIRSVFEYGVKDKSDRDNYLAHVPTAAMIFKEAGYFTGHSGKWHLGGMRQDDYDMRRLDKVNIAKNQPGKENNATSNVSKYNIGSKCPHPGPNQQGFTEYVSVLDGPSAPRQNKLQQHSVLYTQGCDHLIHNDEHIGRSLVSGNNPSPSKAETEGRKLYNTRPPPRRAGRVSGGYSISSTSSMTVDNTHSKTGSASETLSECEARHAIRMMKSSVAKGQPFYIHLWFHAPHGPWQFLNTDENRRQYPAPNLDKIDKSTLAFCATNQVDRFCVKGSEAERGPIMDRLDHKMKAYMSMVTNMDKAIGDVLKTLKDMGIEKDTMVVFTSDNGPENDAGAVPLHKLGHNPWPQWNNWKSLFTTVGMRGNKRFVYEGGIKVPAVVQWVGTIPNGRNSSSVISTVDLLPTFLEAAGIPTPPHVRLDGMSVLSELVGPTKLAGLEEQSSGGDTSGSSSQLIAAAEARKLRHKKNRKALHDRVLLWHNDFEGPRATAARYRDFKLILDGNERPFEMFDLRKDPLELHNLLGNDIANDVATVNEIISGTSMTPLRYNSKHKDNTKVQATETLPTRMRSRSDFHKLIFKKLYRAMLDFALHGNACHAQWLMENPGRHYDATAESDNYFGRGNPYKKISRAQSAANRERMLTTTCASPCSCKVPVASEVQWPWNRVNETLMYMMPGNPVGFLNGSELLLTRTQ